MGTRVCRLPSPISACGSVSESSYFHQCFLIAFCSCGAFFLPRPLFPPVAGVCPSLRLCLRLLGLVALAVPTGGGGHARGPGWVTSRRLRVLPISIRGAWAPLPAPCLCDPRDADPHSACLGETASFSWGQGPRWLGAVGEGCLTAVVSAQRPGHPRGLPAAGRGLGFPAAPCVQSVAVWPPPSGTCLEPWGGGGGPPSLFPTLSTLRPAIRPQLLLGFPGESS